MGSLFSGRATGQRGHTPAAAPPPPPLPATSWFDEEPEPTPVPRRPAKPVGVRFDAELDLTELDDRDRPGLVWSARGRELSRAHLVLRSRRMCYTGRRILLAVHLIDDAPVPLMGRVTSCDYDGDGMYKVELELMQVPHRPEIVQWIEARGR
jgi:hypothetical protein